MAFQSRVDLDNRSFVRGKAVTRDGYTVKQYATAVLAAGTVMAQVSADSELVPLTNLTATDGSRVPKFILVRDVDAQAADVANVEVYEMGEFYDFGVILLNSLDLEDMVSVDANVSYTIRQLLHTMGIVIFESVDIDGPENS